MNIWDRMRKGTQVVSEKSGELLEMAKIKAAISKTETGMVEKYVELGELTYRIYNQEDVDNQRVEKLCAEIKDLQLELRGYQEQLAGLVTNCPACKQPVRSSAKYCPDCGHALRT
jgi:rRNA maturation endonuclease Nob1